MTLVLVPLAGGADGPPGPPAPRPVLRRRAGAAAAQEASSYQPRSRTATSALGILLFVSAWNEYFWPLLVYRNVSHSVIQLGIQNFLNAVSINYGGLMAAAGLATLPILAIYAVLQRRMVNAFVRSGLR